ncbi:Protein P1-P2 [Anopheles sinensis]|uniref:Protein P1-P2 n=1 Tax=Anopheles sinensis TaxID=74873 RepID=A0A084W0U7_ANOSI|nr:Protein P1-P2 [Anopheles sinensis]
MTVTPNGMARFRKRRLLHPRREVIQGTNVRNHSIRHSGSGGNKQEGGKPPGSLDQIPVWRFEWSEFPKAVKLIAKFGSPVNVLLR